MKVRKKNLTSSKDWQVKREDLTRVSPIKGLRRLKNNKPT